MEKVIEVLMKEGDSLEKIYGMPDLDKFLDDLHLIHGNKEVPLGVLIKIDNFQILIGLGSELSFVYVEPEPFDGEFYLSVGTLKGEGDKMFYGAGNDTYWGTQNLVFLDLARLAVRELIIGGTFTSQFLWENADGKTINPNLIELVREKNNS